MNILILGTLGEIEESHRSYAKQSGILIDDELMIDCVEKSFIVSKY